MWLPSTNHQNPATATTIRTSASSSFGLGYHDDILRHGYSSSNKHATSTLAALNYYLERGERRSSSSSMLGRDYINSNIISSSNTTTASAAAANAAPYSSSRWCPTPEQLRTLEDLYRRGIRTPTTHQIQQITGQLRKYGKIEGKNVFYWFQNHKARERQKIKRKLSMSMCNNTTPMTTNGHYDMIHRQRQNNNLYCHDHQYCYPMIDQLQYGRFEEKNSPPVMVRGTGLEAEQTKSSWTSAATTINHTLPKPPHFLQDNTLLPSVVTATGETERDVWMPLLLDSSTTHHRNSNLPVVNDSNNNYYYPCCGLNTTTTHQTHSSSSNSTLVDMSGKLDSGSNSIGIPDEHQNTPKKTLHLFPVVVIDDNDDDESNAPSSLTVDDSDGHPPMNFFQFLPLKG